MHKSIEDIAGIVSVERVDGDLSAAARLLATLAVASDLANSAATVGDAPLQAALRTIARRINDLDDDLLEAMGAYGGRHHHIDRIAGEIVALVQKDSASKLKAC